MIEHPTALLQAYHDGELHGRRLRQVEAHVAQCETCQTELESLDSLSALLTTYSPAPARTPPDRFAAQVGLRLERRVPAPTRQAWVRRGWYLLPVALMVAWIAAKAAFFITNVILAALELEPAANDVAARAAQVAEHLPLVASIAQGGPIEKSCGPRRAGAAGSVERVGDGVHRRAVLELAGVLVDQPRGAALAGAWKWAGLMVCW